MDNKIDNFDRDVSMSAKAQLVHFLENYFESISKSGGAAIEFNKDNQGGFLDVTTSDYVFLDGVTAASLFSSTSVRLEAPDIIIGSGTDTIDVTGGPISIRGATGTLITGHGAGSGSVGSVALHGLAPNDRIIIGAKYAAGAGTDKVGFYDAAGVQQAAHPTTLADVITILQNLGLCS